MSDHDNIEKSKTQLELDREQVQDEIMEHTLSKENELRRKRGLPEIPFYLKDIRSPEEIEEYKNFKRQCLKEAVRKTELMIMAKYLKKTNEGI